MPDQRLIELLRKHADSPGMGYLNQAADRIEVLERQLREAVQQHNACEQELQNRSPEARVALKAEAQRNAAVLEALTSDDAIDAFCRAVDGFDLSDDDDLAGAKQGILAALARAQSSVEGGDDA